MDVDGQRTYVRFLVHTWQRCHLTNAFSFSPTLCLDAQVEALPETLCFLRDAIANKG